MRRRTDWAVGLLLLLASGLWAKPADYVVVVSERTAATAGWRDVVATLAKRHHAQTLTWAKGVDDAAPALKTAFPRYACFVAQSDECGKDFVERVHAMTRAFDDDPYTDCFWGIVTGYDAAAALRIARQDKPLTVRRAAAATEIALDCCQEGLWYCELNQGKLVRRAKGGPPVVEKVPGDTTEALAKALSDYRPDLFVTSGHASERDWMIGYSYRNGFFRCEKGQLYGLDTQQKRIAINSPNPKVYLAVGNCLMGHVDGPDAIALAWMNNAGVDQMAGYTVTSWYGYGGWGLLDYFVEQPGRYSLTEAFFANQAALIWRLGLPGTTEADRRGLTYDKDVLAFYGDPAWVAKMADGPLTYEQALTAFGRDYALTITPKRGAESYATVNKNGSQRGGRPIIAWLPKRVGNIKVTGGAELGAVVTDTFVLVPRPEQTSQPVRLTFTADPVE
ncbi:MAG: hypothetical protein HZB16_04600 [Armatimonadetes bacterium]|nr:hypothetical protein [Armatimonadota bacterium]